MAEITPFKLFEERAGIGKLVPVQKTFLADTETPVSVFAKIRNKSERPFLLESVEGGEKVARYSFIGFRSAMTFRAHQDKWTINFTDESFKKLIKLRKSLSPIEALKQIIQAVKIESEGFEGRLVAGAIGYIGYDTFRQIENLPQLPEDDLNIADMDLGVYTGLITFDNLKHTVSITVSVLITDEKPIKDHYSAALEHIEDIHRQLSIPLSLPDLDAGGEFQWQSNFTKSEFEKQVEKAREYIAAGDIFQVVLSQRFSTEFKEDPFRIYRMLRVLNPSPYLYFFDNPDLEIIGSSPEMLVRVEKGIIETRPIAGTRPRGKTEEEDLALEKELLSDEKERAEHIMLVDLGRNDIGHVSQFGSVELPQLMKIERYSHVMHIVSDCRGKLRKEVDPVDALFACFPAGTVSGAPKIRAMEIIDECETLKRGIYAGAVGYFDFSGNMDWCIAIRTIVVHNGIAYLQAGAGIVADSVPEKEFEETQNKAAALKVAVQHTAAD